MSFRYGSSSPHSIPIAVNGKDLVSQLEYHDIVHRRTPKSQGREKRGSIGCNNVELKRSELIPHYRVQYTVLAQWIVCHPTKVRDLGSNPKRGAIYAISSVGRAQSLQVWGRRFETVIAYQADEVDWHSTRSRAVISE